ncbi:MAG: gentisate 1,2-dioxygenase [Firmicutes bacterium]|nr:gentisate 1,2-dioxygenase [Alicyclobacillaceae bacterium]MCL6496413.1 gentisate 1,2-dioxygenase [Bacillota bacterium]
MTVDEIAEGRRQAFYQGIQPLHLSPLWTVLHAVVTREPVVKEVPHLWAWRAVRPYLEEAARLIGTDEAERRVLVLENPGEVPHPAVTQTLYAGLQIILPGEVARTHRHTANALRFIVEGEGAYTTVDGEKTVMRRGDFVTTPIWSWHDHGNSSDQPMVWLDGLDVPLVNRLNGMFGDPFPTEVQPVTKAPDDSWWRWGQSLRPVGDPPPQARRASPIVNYRYTVARAALEALQRQGDLDPWDGIRLEYQNPVTGGPALPTMAAYLQLLPRGFRTASHRHTSGTVYCVVEGRGRTWAGDVEMRWEPNDVFVVPAWMPHRHEVLGDEEAVLFSFDDAPVQRAFGLYREDKE